MSDWSQGPGWWLASDGRWYPPEAHPWHGGPPRGSGTPQGEDPLATVSLVFGVLGLIPCWPFTSPFSVVAIVTGLVALIRGRGFDPPPQGRSLAITGLILGAVGILAAIVYLSVRNDVLDG